MVHVPDTNEDSTKSSKILTNNVCWHKTDKCYRWIEIQCSSNKWHCSCLDNTSNTVLYMINYQTIICHKIHTVHIECIISVAKQQGNKKYF